jgi:hypothetical protein
MVAVSWAGRGYQRRVRRRDIEMEEKKERPEEGEG